jgi:hypothetical protein
MRRLQSLRLGHYEHRSEPILSGRLFVRRLVEHGVIAVLLLVISLCIGVVGYHAIEGLAWVDAILEAAMILGGMGPLNPLHTSAGIVCCPLCALCGSGVFSNSWVVDCAGRPSAAPPSPCRAALLERIMVACLVRV